MKIEHVEMERRDKEICQLRTEGMTYKAIGKRFGLTKQRVFQICNEMSSRCTECLYAKTHDKKSCNFKDCEDK